MIVNKSDIINLVSKTNNLNISDIEYSIKKSLTIWALIFIGRENRDKGLWNL